MIDEANGTEPVMDALEKLRRDILSADPTDDRRFVDIIRRAGAVLEIDDRELAGVLTVCRLTVTRWKNSITAPHPAMRPTIYRWLLKRMDR